jgi:hypothetical protein
MLILGLLTGLIGGSVLPFNIETVIAGGMLLGVFGALNSPLGLCIGLGLGIASTVKSIVKTVFKSKVQEQVKQGETVEQACNVAEEEATNKFWLFTSTVTVSAFPLYLTTLISGLSGLLLPVSIFAIFLNAWRACVLNPTKTAVYTIVALLIGIGAFFTIGSGSSTAMLLYFLSLITIPSLFMKKKEVESEESSFSKEKVFTLDSFLYANNSNGIILNALLLVQTILWGSGKDVLGTIFNGDLSFIFDPYRIAFLFVLICFLYVYNLLFIDRDIKRTKDQILNNKPEKKGWTFLLTFFSTISALFTMNPLTVIGMVTLGFIINIIAQDNSLVRNISVPALLVIGIFS